VARKSMAERYASQRSGNKPVRRRALPRVGESFDERDDDNHYDTYEDEPVVTTATRGTTSRTATATLPRHEVAGGTTTVIRPRTDAERDTTMETAAVGGATRATRVGGAATMPRRATGARVAPAPMPIRTDYGYVKRDLRRIAITAVAMFILLIVLNLIVRAIIH